LAAIDLTSQRGQVEAKTMQATRLLATVDADLTDFNGLYERFFTVIRPSLSPAFPVDLYRHATMSCVTLALGTETAPDSPEADAAERIGIGCAVPPLPALVEALDAVPDRRTEAYNGLIIVDALREKRGLLEDQLRSLPQDTSDMREYVASQRAEARRVEQALNRKKPEYSDAGYSESKARLKDWRQKLDALEFAVDALDANKETWTQTLDLRLAELYRGIALLGVQ
jgi:hypothetical protein